MSSSRPFYILCPICPELYFTFLEILFFLILFFFFSFFSLKKSLSTFKKKLFFSLCSCFLPALHLFCAYRYTYYFTFRLPNCPTFVFSFFFSLFLFILYFFSPSAVFFCLYCSCFVLLDTHSMSNFNCPTAQVYGSCFLLLRQLFIALSAAALCSFGTCFLFLRQLFCGVRYT